MSASKSFDYITAWHEAAKPAYEALPQNVRDLLARTALVTEGLHQLPDTSMPWPDLDQAASHGILEGVDGFKEAFREIPAEVLALAAQVINNVGHWYPAGAQLEIPGRNSGACCKFSHYADQDLRERLGLPARGDNGRGIGFSLAVHEGAIRITYADSHTWTWVEVAPATVYGKELAQHLTSKIRASAAGIDKRKKNDIRSAYSAAFERVRTLDTRPTLESWPAEWLPFVDHRFMIEGDILKAREEEARTLAASRPEALAKIRARVIADIAQSIANLERERDGMIWFLDHGLNISNCIYYSHTNVFTFGWRDNVSAPVVSQILDVISEFPYAYAIKCADGRTLEGGK